MSNSTNRRKSRATEGSFPRGLTRAAGVWLETPTPMALCRLDLRPPSRWRVFLAVLFTSARYGNREARLSNADLSRMTGLAARTVKDALADLVGRGLLVRIGRYERYQVNLAPEESVPGSTGLSVLPADGHALGGGTGKPTPRRDTVVCTSPTLLSLSSSREKESKVGSGTFTCNQETLIFSVLAEASSLLGSNAAKLSMPPEDSGRLGLSSLVTYGEAFERVAGSGDRVMARDYTHAILESVP